VFYGYSKEKTMKRYATFLIHDNRMFAERAFYY